MVGSKSCSLCTEFLALVASAVSVTRLKTEIFGVFDRPACELVCERAGNGPTGYWYPVSRKAKYFFEQHLTFRFSLVCIAYECSLLFFSPYFFDDCSYRNMTPRGNQSTPTPRMPSSITPPAIKKPLPYSPDLYCGIVGPGSVPPTPIRGAIFYKQKQQRSSSFKDTLLKLSNFASLLCVLDCTILPIISIALPFFEFHDALHELGHTLALTFVLPVGLLATVTNYCYKHQNLWVSSLAILGLLLIGAANAEAVPHWLHCLHHGVLHRVANLSGCAFLMLSNYISHRIASCQLPDCLC
jgi:branched-subunit amino acid transport protein AzlD